MAEIIVLQPGCSAVLSATGRVRYPEQVRFTRLLLT